jgi:Mg2+ and Co2+ transporter CorA
VRTGIETAFYKPAGKGNDNMRFRVVRGNLEQIEEEVPFNRLNNFLNTSIQNWLDITSVAEEDFDILSKTLGIPRILLESRLRHESYPRIDYFEDYSLIFTRVIDEEISFSGAVRIASNRSDLLVLCHGNDIITITRTPTDIFYQIKEKAKRTFGPEEPLAVAILFTVLKHMIEMDKCLIIDVEKQLLEFENTPLKKRGSNFLEITFNLRQEINQLVTELLHTKEIISEITSKSVPLEGFAEKHEKKFHLMLDEVSYVHETASFARDSLIYLVDLYMNTMSYETNKIMRIIAVITSLGILPSIFGLLGSNIVGNPWNIQLWQLFVILETLMVAMVLVFYKLGWLKW